MSKNKKPENNLIKLDTISNVSSLNDVEIREQVQDFYADQALSNKSCCGDDVAKSIYPDDTLSDLPEDLVNFSIGCGDPITIADLQPGEVVVDLGSGGGLDCFMAAKQVGESGRVIGIDMTPEMLNRAESVAMKLGVQNVEFRKGLLEEMPVEDASVDVVTSNCVINLSPDKGKVFSEIYRILKPGGRVSVSDVVTNGELPKSVQEDIIAWGGCVSGALDVEDYQKGLEKAGFVDVRVMAKSDKEGVQYAPDLPIFSAAILAKKSI